MVTGSAPPAPPPEPGLLAGAAEQAGRDLLGQAGVVAVRVADLSSPARRGLGKDGRTALVAAGAGPVTTGDTVVFLKPAAIAAAVVRRDGRCRLPGTRRTTCGSGWPRSSWMSWPGHRT